MEGGNDVEEGLAWERSTFGRELERIQAATEAECNAILQRLSQRGMLYSGATVTEIIEAYERMLREIAEAKIALRRKVIDWVPALGSADALQDLENEITGFVETKWKNIHNHVTRWVGGTATPQGFGVSKRPSLPAPLSPTPSAYSAVTGSTSRTGLSSRRAPSRRRAGLLTDGVE